MLSKGFPFAPEIRIFGKVAGLEPANVSNLPKTPFPGNYNDDAWYRGGLLLVNRPQPSQIDRMDSAVSSAYLGSDCVGRIIDGKFTLLRIGQS
jgi:hypothetical protein